MFDLCTRLCIHLIALFQVNLGQLILPRPPPDRWTWVVSWFSHLTGEPGSADSPSSSSCPARELLDISGTKFLSCRCSSPKHKCQAYFFKKYRRS